MYISSACVNAQRGRYFFSPKLTSSSMNRTNTTAIISDMAAISVACATISVYSVHRHRIGISRTPIIRARGVIPSRRMFVGAAGGAGVSGVGRPGVIAKSGFLSQHGLLLALFGV